MRVNKKFIITIAIEVGLLIIGILISYGIHKHLQKKYQTYDNAVIIESEKDFRKCLENNVGYVFAYGELKVLDPISDSNISGEYSYIKRVTQKYQKHTKTQTKTYKDSNGKEHTKTEIKDYWSWDTKNTEEWSSKKISFLGVEFFYGRIPFPKCQKIATVNAGTNKRYVYYATNTNFKGTIFASLNNKLVEESKFYENKNISETIKYLKSGIEIKVFWIIWIFISIVINVVVYFWGKI